MCSQYFEGNKIIVTVPVSALQADENDLWYIEFAPAILQYTEAAKHIGFGTVIKIILQFSDSFWSEAKKDAGFILTGEKIPTWWTQLPQKDPILTGWFGGPKAAAFKSATDEEILEAALQSLASAFAKPIDFIKNKLQAHKLANWSNVPNISGGYSYNKPGSYEAKKLFGQPIEETIFFAGEAFFRGDTSGTVEAALISGREAALRVLQQ